MGMIDRYRKKGGFLQLLQLIETTDAAKREKFLKMIHDEDKVWGNAVSEKMLSMDKIFAWDANAIGEIMVRLPELTLAVALHGMDKTREEIVLRTFSSGQKRRIHEAYSTKKPNPNEINSAFIKIIEEVRGMVKSGALRFEKLDPALSITPEFEDGLLNQARPKPSLVQEPKTPMGNPPKAQPAKPTNAPVAQPKVALDPEADKVMARLLEMTNENSNLRKEIKALKDEIARLKAS